MSNDSSRQKQSRGSKVVSGDSSKGSVRLSWGPFAAIAWTILIYVVPQVIGGLIVSIYPALKHWDPVRANDWITNAVSAQFVYGLLAESMSIGIVWLLLRHYRAMWYEIGLMLPRAKDALYALGGFGIYFTAYIVLVVIATSLIPSFNANQQQDVGFQHTSGFVGPLMAFISLVVLPPFAEEIIFRGFLFKGLRRKFDFRVAAIITSLLFALPHLIEGVGGLLWIGGLDTFVLSIVLCYLRETTGRLTAGMGVHALKNALAFAMLFIFHVH